MFNKLDEIIAKPLGIICETLGEVPEDWERASIVPIFKKWSKKGLWYLQTNQSSLDRKILERIIREYISKYMIAR